MKSFRWSRVGPWMGVAFGVALAGCNPNVACRVRVAPAGAEDGGRFACAASEDCPRPDNVVVCVSNATPQQECVRCVASQCENVVPAGC